jgi:phage terminase large subunit-like protein
MMRELVRAPSHNRDRSLGHFLCNWIEHHCVHGPGDVEGAQIELDSEFAGFIVDCYVLDEDGRRQYDSAFISRAKGRAKSELAGFIVLAEGLTQVRFSHWAEPGEIFSCAETGCLITDCDFTYSFEDAEPVGRPVVSPVIRCLATEEGQAGNTYDNVYFNLTIGPMAAGMSRDGAGLTRVFLPNGGEIIPSTASNSAKDGGKETFVVFDETHLYVQPELHRMYATVRRNLAKRKAASPWSLETSTMYMSGQGSVAEGTHKLAKLIALGKTKRARVLFDHREAEPTPDLSNEVKVLEGLREAYGPFADVMDLQRIVDEIFDPRNDPSDSRRYYFNQANSAQDAWVAEVLWRACGPLPDDAPERPVKGDVITVGFDGSEGRVRGKADATALVGCRVSDGLLFELGVWEQPDGPDGVGWVPPMADVEATVADTFKTYQVIGMYCDPAAKWTGRIDAWEGKYLSRLKVRGSVAGHPMYWWMSGRRGVAVADALSRTYEAIANREIRHLGERSLTRHVLNARRRVGAQGVQIHKENPESVNKIDAAVAAVLAYTARQDAVAKGVVGRVRTAPKRIY